MLVQGLQGKPILHMICRHQSYGCFLISCCCGKLVRSILPRVVPLVVPTVKKPLRNAEAHPSSHACSCRLHTVPHLPAHALHAQAHTDEAPSFICWHCQCGDSNLISYQ
jgi:hypothetical protein